METNWLRLVENEGSLGAEAEELLRKARLNIIDLEKYGFFVDGNGVSKIVKLD